jgi:hypothetical protein
MHFFITKLLATPVMICAAYLAGQRWGSAASGILIGLPLVSGLVSVFLACEQGPEFSARAAAGTMAGQISLCLYCLVFCAAGQKAGCLASSCAAMAAFLVSTWVLRLVDWPLIPAFFGLMFVLALVLKLIPVYPVQAPADPAPRWDLPARIVVATGFVLALTGLAGMLGPQLSGLIAPFPVLSTVFAVFIHVQQGPKVMSNFLRGMVLGIAGNGAFFLVIGGLLPRLGIAAAYLLASGLAVLINVAFIRGLGKSREHGPDLAD